MGLSLIKEGPISVGGASIFGEERGHFRGEGVISFDGGTVLTKAIKCALRENPF